jgi:hypothetical protein
MLIVSYGSVLSDGRAQGAEISLFFAVFERRTRTFRVQLDRGGPNRQKARAIRLDLKPRWAERPEGAECEGAPL